MKAREIMTVAVATVCPHTSVHEAAALLTERGITSLPVLDDDGSVVGIVSEGDLIHNRMPHDSRSHLRPAEHQEPDPARRVGDVMSHTVICLGENADTADLAALMVDNKVRAVPIVDGAHLVGIVSRRDLLRTLLRDDEAIRADIVARLAEYSGDITCWNVCVEDGVATIRGLLDDVACQETINALARAVPGVLRVHTRPRTVG